MLVGARQPLPILRRIASLIFVFAAAGRRSMSFSPEPVVSHSLRGVEKSCENVATVRMGVMPGAVLEETVDE